MLAALGQHSSKQLMRNRAVTVAILAQGTSWAVAVTQAFLQVESFGVTCSKRVLVTHASLLWNNWQLWQRSQATRTACVVCYHNMPGSHTKGCREPAHSQPRHSHHIRHLDDVRQSRHSA